MEMILELGYCNGIENYSRYLSGRAPGEPPPTLFDYLPDDALLVIDESHVTRAADRRHVQRRPLAQGNPGGVRLPPALGAGQPAAASSTSSRRRCPRRSSSRPRPAAYELENSRSGGASRWCVPPGLVDPEMEVRPATTQVDDLLSEIRQRVAAEERVLVTTLTKRMAEDLTEYLARSRRAGALPALGHRHRGARGDHPRPARWARSTCWWASTCCARAWTCPRCRWWRFSTPTRRASCAASAR